MGKKYGQDRHDREDERIGMERYERRMKREERGYGRNFVTGNDPMIGRDSYAGLPEEKVCEEYPRNRMMPGGRLDDSMREIDAIQSDSERDLQRHLSNQK